MLNTVIMICGEFRNEYGLFNTGEIDHYNIVHLFNQCVVLTGAFKNCEIY